MSGIMTVLLNSIQQQEAVVGPVPEAGSLVFSGSKQYLDLTPGFTPASDGFTIEGWFYSTIALNSRNIGLWGSNQTVGLSAYFNTSRNTITLDRFGSGFSPSYTFASNFLPNIWYYIALNRNADQVETMWAGANGAATATKASAAAGGTGGISGGQQIDAQNWGVTNWVGKYNGGAWQGYITNFRATMGTAVYDSTASTIPMPITPFAVLPNTRYLMLGAVTTADAAGIQTIINDGGVTQTSLIKPF